MRRHDFRAVDFPPVRLLARLSSFPVPTRFQLMLLLLLLAAQTICLGI